MNAHIFNTLIALDAPQRAEVIGVLERGGLAGLGSWFSKAASISIKPVSAIVGSGGGKVISGTAAIVGGIYSGNPLLVAFGAGKVVEGVRQIDYEGGIDEIGMGASPVFGGQTRAQYIADLRASGARGTSGRTGLPPRRFHSPPNAEPTDS